MNFLAIYKLIVRELASKRLRESMDKVIAKCSKEHPHDDWEELRALPYDDMRKLKKWIDVPFTEEPSPVKLRGLWFGIFNPIRSRKPVADIYVSGTTRFDPNPLDNSWAVRPKWWPENRYAHSVVMARIFRIAYRENGLGNDAEYPLCLACGALAVRDLLRSGDHHLFLGTAKSLGVAVGFDSGDFVLIGKLTPSGLVAIQ